MYNDTEFWKFSRSIPCRGEAWEKGFAGKDIKRFYSQKKQTSFFLQGNCLPCRLLSDLLEPKKTFTFISCRTSELVTSLIRPETRSLILPVSASVLPIVQRVCLLPAIVSTILGERARGGELEADNSFAAVLIDERTLSDNALFWLNIPSLEP